MAGVTEVAPALVSCTMPHHPRFICDVMLGSLARWLRLLGYDTLYYRYAGDNELIRIALAERRILVTRDHALYRRCLRQTSGRTSSVFISADKLSGQVREVLISACKDFSAALPLRKTSRCASCNGDLQSIGRDDLPPEVPGHVRVSHSSFQQCASCRKVYWDGSHTERIEETIRGFEKMMREG